MSDDTEEMPISGKIPGYDFSKNTFDKANQLNSETLRDLNYPKMSKKVKVLSKQGSQEVNSHSELESPKFSLSPKLKVNHVMFEETISECIEEEINKVPESRRMANSKHVENNQNHFELAYQHSDDGDQYVHPFGDVKISESMPPLQVQQRNEI